MSQESLEVVRAAIKAANRGDWDAVFKDAAPGFEWDNSRAIGADNRAVFTVDEARSFFSKMVGMFESVQIEVEQLITVGDHVLVPHVTHVQARDGLQVQARTTWAFLVRDGRVERVTLYQDPEEALESVQAQG